jgi:uncharacterized protein
MWLAISAAIFACLVIEGGRKIARNLAASKQEAQVPGGSGAADSNPEIRLSGVHLRRTLSSPTATAALYDAIDAGDLAEVQLYVSAGVDVEALGHGERERSPFFHAAAMNRLEMVQYFVGLGYDKEVGGRNGAPVLYAAAQEGHIAMVQYLVEQGADKNKAINNGATPLYIAAQEGHVAVVQYLVEQGADKEKAINDGTTPLLIAAANGHLTVVRYLVEQGADTNKVDGDGMTPLMVASY